MAYEDFLDCTLNEIDLLLSEQKKYNSLSKLELASYMGALVMNEKGEDNYKAIYNEITGEETTEDKTITRKRIKMISTRLGLRCPFIDEEGNIIKEVA